MPDSSNHSLKQFTFLNYNNPDHSALHRRAVKSHISSKYRTGVRRQTQTRYALPHRSSAVGAEPTEPKRQRNRKASPPTAISSPILGWAQLPSPLVVGFRGTRVDPFISFPGQVTPSTLRALDYFVQGFLPLMKPLFLAMDMADPLWVWKYQWVTSQESAYHAIIALMQTHLERMRTPAARASTEVIYHRSKAVSILRTCLSNLDGPPDDGVLITVLFLACLDTLYNDDKAANRKGLALIVALKGGLDNLGLHGLIKAYILQVDYFWTQENGSEPLFPALGRRSQHKYPRHPFSSDELSLVASLPPGFAELARHGALGIDVLGILSRVSIFLKTAPKPKHGKSTTPSPVLGDDETYPDLFEVCASLQSSNSTKYSLEKNLVLAVILLNFDKENLNGTIPSLVTYQGCQRDLTRSIPYTMAGPKEERPCLIWVWMIVLRSWNEEAPGGKQTMRLGQTFFKIFVEVGSWAQVETVMRRFFWYEPLADSFRRAWLSAFKVFKGYSTNPHVLKLEDGASINAGPS